MAEQHECEAIEPSIHQRVADLAADRAIAKFAASHICHFPEDQRANLHAVSGLDPEALKVVIKASKAVQGALGSVANFVAKAIVIGLLFFFIIGAILIVRNSGVFNVGK